MSISLELAKQFLNKQVTVTVDRPLGSKHPKYDYIYPVNYGYITGFKAPDGEDLDAYILGVSTPLSSFDGICIAIIHRTKDDDDKLVVVPSELYLSVDEIEKTLEFQEKWFDHEIIVP